MKGGGYTFGFEFANGIPLLTRVCAPDIKLLDYSLPTVKTGGGRSKSKSKTKTNTRNSRRKRNSRKKRNMKKNVPKC